MEKQHTKVLNTRKKILDALIALTKEKKIQQISISELCREAKINRTTFYLHYQDINDLIEVTQEAIIEGIKKEIKKSKITKSNQQTVGEHLILVAYQDILGAFRNVADQKELVTMLLGENGDPVFQYNNRKALRDLMEYILQDYLPEFEAFFSDIPKDYLEVILYGAIVNIIMIWLERGMIEPPEQIAEIIITAFRHATPFSVINKRPAK